jgi:hypothetical protein
MCLDQIVMWLDEIVMWLDEIVMWLDEIVRPGLHPPNSRTWNNRNWLLVYRLHCVAEIIVQ